MMIVSLVIQIFYCTDRLGPLSELCKTARQAIDNKTKQLYFCAYERMLKTNEVRTSSIIFVFLVSKRDQLNFSHAYLESRKVLRYVQCPSHIRNSH